MSERLFFALWPDESLRDSIARRLPQWTAGIDGRLQRPDQWHVTLEFLGEVAAERRDALHAAAGRVPMRPAVIEFDWCEVWRKPQVSCLVASQTPPALAQLVTGLRAALAVAGFTPDSRPFQPHVTLARKVRFARHCVVEPPLRWPMTGFVLVRSLGDPAGSRYEPVHWWNGSDRGG